MAHVQKTNSGLWAPQSTHEKIISQKMFIDNIEQQEKNYTDLIGRIHGQVNSITELKALDVSSEGTIIKSGTVVMVTGVGLFYYNPSSTVTADDEEIVQPTTGSGRWILSGGGGNLIVDEVDYGEDIDSDQDGIVLKIKKLFNKKLKTNFFPITTTKAVRDTTTGKTLFDLLGIIPISGDEEDVESPEVRDADTLAGLSPDIFARKSDYNGIICVLLSDKWVLQSDGTYKYFIAVPSLTGNEFFDVNLYDDGTATSGQIDAFNEYVTRIDVNAGEVVIQASTKPSVTFSIILRGMCTVDNTIVTNLSEVMEKYDEVKDMTEDTGWIECTLYESATVRGSDSYFTPKIRKIGKHVILRGQIIIAEPTVGTAMPVLDIPAGFAPSYEVWSSSQKVNGYNYEVFNIDNVIYVKPSIDVDSESTAIYLDWFID